MKLSLAILVMFSVMPLHVAKGGGGKSSGGKSQSSKSNGDKKAKKDGEPHGTGSAAAGGAENLADSEASVEIRLSPPRHPLPEVTGQIEVLDRARRLTEERQTARLLKAYDSEVSRARSLITVLIREALSVFDDPAVVPSFIDLDDPRNRPGRIWVSVEDSPPIDGSVLKRMESVEEKNAKKEKQIFQAAVEDMSEVTRFTLQQLNETLVNAMRPVIATRGGNGYSSFIALQAGNQRCNELKAQFGDLMKCDSDLNGTRTAPPVGHHEHQLTVFANEHLYPTVESLVQDMLKRREVDENLFKARTLSLMARLAQTESRIASELLQSAVASITVQYSNVIDAVNMTKGEQTGHTRLHAQTVREGRRRKLTKTSKR